MSICFNKSEKSNLLEIVLSVSGYLPFKDDVAYLESTLELNFLIYFIYLQQTTEIVSQPVQISFVRME